MSKHARMPIEEIFVQYRIIIGERLCQSRETRGWDFLQGGFVCFVANAANVQHHPILRIHHVVHRTLKISSIVLEVVAKVLDFPPLWVSCHVLVVLLSLLSSVIKTLWWALWRKAFSLSNAYLLWHSHQTAVCWLFSEFPMCPVDRGAFQKDYSSFSAKKEKWEFDLVLWLLSRFLWFFWSRLGFFWRLKL